jgi:hypothetical protein
MRCPFSIIENGANVRGFRVFLRIDPGGHSSFSAVPSPVQPIQRASFLLSHDDGQGISRRERLHWCDACANNVAEAEAQSATIAAQRR